jgi:MYXO-CTERM domain-containing protein
MRAQWFAAAVLLAVVAPAPSASAANELKPRVPVAWPDGPCATVVDKSIAPLVHFEYAVGVEEDPEDRTADEVDDSRTHQFFAFRKQDLPGNDPPDWITRADIERAAMRDPTVVPTAISADMVLEETTQFAADEWVRITPDDARVPITFAQAAMGVDWDTSAVEPGTYEIWAYTWEPKGNIWSRRPGFVKVIASAADADAAGPSIALLPDERVLAVGDDYAPPGCADVAAGTVVTIEWGARTGTIVPEWNLALEHQPIETGALDLSFVLPSAAVSTSLVLRATVKDESCESYVAYAPKVLAVSASGEEVAADPQRGDDPCAPPGEGCGCATDQRSLAPLVLLPLAFVRRRRR